MTRACPGPRSGGKVEGLVKFARSNFMTPIPVAASFHDLNTMLAERCLARQAERAGRHTATNGERLAADLEAFRDPPAVPLEPLQEAGSARLIDGAGRAIAATTTRFRPLTASRAWW